MKKLFLFLFAAASATFAYGKKPIELLVVTGGHKFDTIEFFDMFARMKDVKVTHLGQPDVLRYFTHEKSAQWDAILFYDMMRIAPPAEERRAFEDMVRRGRSVFFFHHAMCAYDDWPEWLDLVGAKYVARAFTAPDGTTGYPRSKNKQQCLTRLHVVPGNGVVKGVKDFEYKDEYYSELIRLPDMKPIIEGYSEGASYLSGWHHTYGEGEVVTFIQGHDKTVFAIPEFTEVMHQMIRYLAKKNH